MYGSNSLDFGDLSCLARKSSVALTARSSVMAYVLCAKITSVQILPLHNQQGLSLCGFTYLSFKNNIFLNYTFQCLCSDSIQLSGEFNFLRGYLKKEENNN